MHKNDRLHFLTQVIGLPLYSVPLVCVLSLGQSQVVHLLEGVVTVEKYGIYCTVQYKY